MNMKKEFVRNSLFFLKIIFLGLAFLLAAQSNNLAKTSYQHGPLILLQNALYPQACLDNENNIICSSTHWDVPFPIVARKVSPTGICEWSTDSYGVLATQPKDDGDETSRSGFLLANPDGGVFLGYDYLAYVDREELAIFFNFRPMLQSINSDGLVEWGDNGIELTTLQPIWWGGATTLGMWFDSDDNIMCVWSWTDFDSSAILKFSGTYLQKVNHNGDLLLGDTGEQIFDQMATEAFISKCGNVYLLSESRIVCLDQNGNELWKSELLAGLENISATRKCLATNDIGDLLILYKSGQGLTGRLFTKNGETVWFDKLLIQGDIDVFSSSPLLAWGEDKWLFASDKIYIFNREGTLIGTETGITIPDSAYERIENLMVVDENTFYVAYTTKRIDISDPINLKIQKFNLNGDCLFNQSGILLVNVFNETVQLLPASDGGLFAIMDAGAIYEPEYRPRGSYIQKVGRDGDIGFVTGIDEKVPLDIPDDFEISNYPNPFHHSTIISIQGNFEKNNDSFELCLYNILGKEVKRFHVTNDFSTIREYRWDGTGDNGQRVAEGVYFYRLIKNSKKRASGKLLFLRY